VTHIDIESPSNPRVKGWRQLRSRRERDATGTFLIEGERETLRAAAHLEVVEVILRADRSNVELDTPTVVSERVFVALSARQHPDGVAAIVRTPSLLLETLALGSNPVVLVADGVEKPGNVGAIIRSCDGLGAAFIGSSLGTDVVNPNVVRSAQGSLFSTAIAAAPRTDVIEWCGQRTQIIVARPDDEATLWECDLTVPTSIVVGAEDVGVHGDWLDVGTSASLPMSGSADSLNTAATAAIFLAEALRQRSA
jgi:TrmH family RNA methyltransferase